MATFPLPLETRPMEARTAEALPEDGGPWQYEPKWDGFRCVAFKSGSAVDLRGKSGKPLGRFFPEISALLKEVPFKQFVVDGELVIEIGGRLAFDALQMRLHPAESRIRKLAAETPARLILFDMLADSEGQSIMHQALKKRRKALTGFMKSAAVRRKLILSPATTHIGKARAWLEDEEKGATDGVIAKKLDESYVPGERLMIKVKRLRTADCVVGGFRYLAERREVGSLLLGLYDDKGKLNHVGFTSTIRNEERAALTQKLERLKEPPGFTGDAPGGPSRWSTERSAEWQPLRPELVAEVRFDHVTAGRFRHGTKFMRWRPDKSPRQCTCDQLALPAADIK
jgi:ATP-dependent DNA ligase